MTKKKLTCEIFQHVFFFYIKKIVNVNWKTYAYKQLNKSWTIV
jgi:hypothetical protein